ncbi:hypothetical protein JCM3774_006840 [Rhodotorula dairenensis]
MAGIASTSRQVYRAAAASLAPLRRPASTAAATTATTAAPPAAAASAASVLPEAFRAPAALPGQSPAAAPAPIFQAGDLRRRAGPSGAGPRASSRFYQPYKLHVYSTRNNTILTLSTSPSGAHQPTAGDPHVPVAWVSAGSAGYKGAARGTYDAAVEVSLKMFKKIHDLVEPPVLSGGKKLKAAGPPPTELELVWKGFGQGRDAVFRTLMSADGDNIRHLVRRVTDATPLKIGGTRPKKRRVLAAPLCVPAPRSSLTSSARQFARTRMAQPTSTTVNKDAHAFERASLESLLIRRFFYAPAFEIYGGVKGLYDYGPPGSSLQANIIDTWRKHFIIEEEMLELDTTIMTLSDVLKTSGHVDKFTDWMVRDAKTNEVYRADHLIEGVLEARLKGDKEARGVQQVQEEEDATAKKKKKKVKSVAVKLDDHVVQEYEEVLAKIDNYTGAELGHLIREYKIVAPETGNEVTEPVEFNLMFDSNIGPTGQIKGYLRPETAQGHFVNFNRLLDFNNGRVPFASAQIGRSFRNEISPRSGLLRVREFTMAEIEHFVDPLDKNHERFEGVKDIKLRLLPKDVQAAGKTDISELTIGEAVKSGMVDNETLGYFIARIYLFLTKIGINPARLRFRQHMANEMAHYAADCWDAEIETSYGWIECVGCADRSAYDLTVHSNKTQNKMVVRQALKEPRIVQRNVPAIDKKAFGPLFKKEAKPIEEAINAMSEAELAVAMKQLQEQQAATIKAAGQEFQVPASVFTITPTEIKEQVREFVPNVIEPSFGIGRILYSLLEHSYWARADDVNRAVLSLPPTVAPIKCLIVPLSSNAEFKPLVSQVSQKLRSLGIASRVDDSNASIGKRYARNDELGTPFGVTLDFASVKNQTMTLRERDTTLQLIGSIDEVISVVNDLCKATISWEEAQARLKPYTGEQEV